MKIEALEAANKVMAEIEDLKCELEVLVDDDWPNPLTLRKYKHNLCYAPKYLVDEFKRACIEHIKDRMALLEADIAEM